MFRKRNFLILLILSIFISSILIPSTTYGFDEDIFNNRINKQIPANSLIQYNFLPWNNILEISTDTFLNLSYSFLTSIFSRQFSLEINNSDPVDLNLDLRIKLSDFNISYVPSFPELQNISFQLNFNSIYKFISNVTVHKITFRMQKNELYGIDPEKNYSLAYVKNEDNSWNLIDTHERYDESKNQTILEGSLENTQANESYYLTLIQTKFNLEENPPNLIWIWFIVLSGIIISGIVIVISKKDYINYLKTRLVDIQKGSHQLSLEEVLENKNRMKIIDLILKKPGIHFNELLRETNLSPGNLVWHLDILETYKVIGKRRISNYVVYIPYYEKNPLSNIDLKLQKSELTLEVLNIIEKNPGIWNSKIADKLNSHRKTISYHVKKLLDLDLIYRKKEGLRMKIYPKLEKEYFQDD
jgi:DNA-binding transcriptional ArsR family regulator